MADKKISELDPAAALTGTEILPITQSGDTVRTTTSAIAALASGGGNSMEYSEFFKDETLLNGILPSAGDPLSTTMRAGSYYFDATIGRKEFASQPITLVANDANYLDYEIATGLVTCNQDHAGPQPGFFRMAEIDTGATTVDDAYGWFNQGYAFDSVGKDFQFMPYFMTGTSQLVGRRSNSHFIMGALQNATAATYAAMGAGNTLIGVQVSGALTGTYNTLLATQISKITSGSINTFGGYAAGYELTTGTGNTAYGDHALFFCNGNDNTAIGRNAGDTLTSGIENTFVGHAAGVTLTTGNNNSFLGKGAQPATATTSNSITLGNSSITVLRCQVTSITALSDARDKKDVVDLSFGLDFIRKLRPVEFTWDMRDGGKVDVKDSGFIAQELKAAQEEADGKDVLQLVYEDNPEKLEASAGRLIPVLVKAIQELAAELEELKKKVNGN